MHTTSQAPSPATTIAERLSGGEPYIITFGGQATPWRQTLADLVSLDQALADDVVTVDRAVAERLASVATDLLTVTPRGSRLLNDEAAPVVPQHRTTADSADVSVPGILMAQHAALASLPAAGIDTTAHAPVGAIGHSQGVLGVSLLDAVRAGNREGVIEVHAIARLIGAAATRATRRLDLGTVGESTPMLSVRGVTRSVLDSVLSRVPGSERISVGVTNGLQAHILSGRPADLERVVTALEAAAARSAKARKDRRRGGAVLAPVIEFLTTSVPFHPPLLAGAVVLTRIRKAKMQIEDSVFWVLSAMLFILLAAFPPLIYRLTEFFSVQSPANLLFLLVIAILFMKVFSLSLKVSLLEEKLSSLAQSVALRERFAEEAKENREEKD